MNETRGSGGLVPAGEKSRLGYQPALDGIRAIAALAVVGFHLRIAGLDGGALGVDMFFVLSGFLITSILLAEFRKTETIRFGRFYARRALRLLPAYVAVVIFAMALYVLVVHTGSTRRGVIASFFYVANWVVASGQGLGALGHTWSLSIEEQFYLVWPLLLFTALRLIRGRGSALVAVVAGVWLIMWVATLIGVFVLDVGVSLLTNGTHFRSTELLAGCLLAAVAARGWLKPLTDRPLLSNIVGIASLAGLLALIIFGTPTTNPELIATWLAVSVCTVGLIASLQGARRTTASAILSFRPLVALGIVSYGIYLWHFPIFVTVDELWGLDTWGPRLVAIVGTAVMVVVSYFVIERPFLRLKDRIAKSRRSRSPSPIAES